jgi:phosphohistidine swiveling domain-containing protein
MKGVFSYNSDCILLDGSQVLQKFRTGEFSDKTFSKLYARWLDIQTLPGIVFDIRNSQLYNMYCITPDMKDFFVCHDVYLVHYDFRINFTTLEHWLKEKKVRPKACFCSKEEVGEQIEQSLQTGLAYTSDFFLLATAYFPDYRFIMGTTNKQVTYIECSENYKATHGVDTTNLCILRRGEIIQNETDLSTDYVNHIAEATRKFTSILGDNATCEFFLVDDTLYLFTAQNSTTGEPSLSGYYTEDMKTICPGTLEGTVKWVDKASLSETIKDISGANKKFVFLAERPYSEFIDLLQFAGGFIFSEGSTLCHLAILLREREIPARLIRDSTDKYEDGTHIFLK